MDENIRYAGIFGIINLIVTVPLLIIEFVRSKVDLNAKFIFFYVVAYLIYIVLYIIFIWGFVLIGKKLKISFLVNMSYLLIIVSAIWVLAQLFSLVLPQLAGIVFQVAILFVMGVVSIPFGVSLLRLKKKLGGLATAAGVLNIIAGASLATIILSFIGVLLILPVYIVEIILLFRASKKL